MAEQSSSGKPRVKLLRDGDTFEIDGRQLRLRIHGDPDMGPPWKEDDGVGEVSDWERRKKAPHERILCEDCGSYRFYDVQASMKKALKDWVGDEVRTAEGTRQERAAKLVEADFKRLYGWCNDHWSYIYLVVELVGETRGQTESLGGVESDCEEYISELALELGHQLLDRLYEKRRAALKDMPSLEQIKALLAWAEANGRTWKSKLDAAWMKAGEGVPGYCPALQQVRNQFGPSWLVRMSLPKLKRLYAGEPTQEEFDE